MSEKLPRDMLSSPHPLSEGSQPTDWADMTRHAHFVEFYDDAETIADSVAKYLVHGLRFGETCIIVATPERYRLTEKKVRAQYPDLPAALADGKFIALDARETLDKFMDGDGPNARRFDDVVGGVIRKARASNKNVRVFGEMVAVLTDDGNTSGALRVEQLWNALAEKLSFRLYCAYPKKVLSVGKTSAFAADICLSHTHVVGQYVPAMG